MRSLVEHGRFHSWACHGFRPRRVTHTNHIVPSGQIIDPFRRVSSTGFPFRGANPEGLPEMDASGILGKMGGTCRPMFPVPL